MLKLCAGIGAVTLSIIAAASGWAQPSQQPPSTLPPIQIVGAEQVSPIAISGLKNLGGDEDGKVSSVFSGTLIKDLKLSGYFRVIDPAAYVENPQNSGYDIGQFNWSDWSSINAEFLVKGAAKREQGKVSLEAMLFDVGEQRRIMGRKFVGQPREVGEMARRFADALMQSVTGMRGPFSTKLAFASTRGGHFKEIYTSWLDGGSLFRVTDNPTINLFPSFDKSSAHLLYLSYKTMSPALYLVDLGRGIETRIEPPLGMAVGGALAPDGRIIGAFSRGGQTNLYLLDQSGAEIRALTDNHAINVSPSPCMNGGEIAFTSDRTGNPQIYVMGLNGGNTKRITFSGEYNTAPAFSRDCKQIAYEGRNGGTFQIFVNSANGGDARQLTTEGSNENPSWSPDGRYIAFSSRRGGETKIYMMLAADGKITGALTEGQGNDTNPSWSWWIGG
jgi:TolB protein